MQTCNLVKENEKVTQLSYSAGIGVCIGIVFMSVACFLQKPWRFEVGMFLISVNDRQSTLNLTTKTTLFVLLARISEIGPRSKHTKLNSCFFLFFF